MNRRQFLKAGAAAVAVGGLSGCQRERPAQPGIVVVIADQLRANLLGAYGGRMIETPHLDRLAAEGTTLENALSTTPLCTPYRGMLMTGRYPTHSGVILNGIDISPQQNPDTLGVLFQRGGYDTGYIGKWHLAAGELRMPRKVRNDPEAYAAWVREHLPPEFVPPGPERLGFRHWEAYNYHADAQQYWFYRDTPERIETDRHEIDVQTEQAIDYLQERVRDEKPFLLVVSPHPPHPPYKIGNCRLEDLEHVPRKIDLPPNVPENDPLRRDPSQARYHLAMIRHLDESIGRLLRHLDESGLSSSTLLIFTADHGEMLGSHGEWGKQQPYRESVGVPLIARWPGVVPAGVHRDLIYTPMDHLPTLASLAGIETPRYLDGMDLSGHLLGDEGPRRDAALMMGPVSGRRTFGGEQDLAEWRALESADLSYILWRSGTERLFDRRSDPYQMNDLSRAAEHAARLAASREQLRVLMSEAHDEFLAGRSYSDWYSKARTLERTALGPVPSF